MKKSRYVYLSLYYADSVYEPAEGGYYVPVLYFSKAVRMSYRHAMRKLRQHKAILEREGCLTGSSKRCVNFRVGHWHRSAYSDIYIVEDKPGLHEILYHGYC